MAITNLNSIISSLIKTNNDNCKNIIFTQNNTNKINEYEKNTEIIKLTLYNTNKFYYYNKNLYYDSFDSDTSVTEYKMSGIFSINNNIITITGNILKDYTSYKQTFDKDGYFNNDNDKQILDFNIDELIGGKWGFQIF